MGIFDKLFKKQKKYLNTSEHYRAFSANPEADYCQLIPSKDNSEAIQFIKRVNVKLKHVQSGNTVGLKELKDCRVVFLVTWDPYCAKSIGSLKKIVDEEGVDNWSIVLFEEEEDFVKSNKSNSWYYHKIYVLEDDSKELVKMIGQVPLSVYSDNSENLIEFKTGLLE